MNKKLYQHIILLVSLFGILATYAYAQTSTNIPVAITIKNQGGAMEGHTPRGFAGMGTGLFVGDNLNPRFPDGDGVQMFLTFDLADVPRGSIVSAVISSQPSQVQGNPFQDLGAITAQEIRYSNFYKALWNIQTDNSATRCVFADSINGPFQCDVSRLVQRSLDDGYQYAQLLLRFDKAGDNDGKSDMVYFYNTDSNTNEAGIFKLAVSVVPDEAPEEIVTDRSLANSNESNNDNIFSVALIGMTAIIILMLFLNWRNKAKTK